MANRDLKKYFLIILVVFTWSCSENTIQQAQVVQLAKLEIDPDQLDSYLLFLNEGISRSVATEPGVLMLSAVADKTNPHLITVFEIYADTAACRSHIASAHFQKYKTSTLKMVKSLELVPVNPII